MRPSITTRELAESMAKEGQDRVLVTTLDGRLDGQWLTEGHELGYPTAEDLDYHL